MTQIHELPVEIEKYLSQIGERIRIARKRRMITMEDMASRMFVTRKTLSRLEKGDPGVSLAVFASALWVLGLEKNLLEIAVPEKDKTGIFLEQQRLPERIRKQKNKDDLDF
ncbi:helix-turn-helix domain-containing protein [Desulforegula conservatrix]|uniref:helix-turn-helix domain-containing protein n=1 Tax=Desulforegula conservatrix TaxID=153026 RepID=UPI000402D389|nr:helix-turn-helix transcriptional regulator [Desulforegula conservatrix]